MKIAFNPSTGAALTAPPNNKDITFDLRGRNIFARGVKFQGTDTNTWRDIKVNNVSIGSNVLDLRNGSNTTLTNTDGVVTINSTWRPVVDNLTSNSTTSSLSANQGRVLAGLINGKSDSDHNHDGRYLKLTGGWMSGDINFGGDNRIHWGRNTDSASISFKNNGDADSYMSFVTSDNGNEYFRWSHSSGSTNTEWMALRSDGLRVGGTKVSLEGHSHNDLYYTKTEVNNKLNGKSDTGHTHDDRYLKLTGGTMQLGKGLKFHSNNNYFGTNADARIISLLDGNDRICDGGLIIDERATLDGKEYVTELLRIRDSEFKWRGADILHSGNYSGILDARYYTESEINSLLDAKLNRQNLSYGTWNPRGYNLAADYHYNGGDLSISENSNKIFVSIDGSFWQNEGRYRVLDTSDVASLKGDLTVHQHLSATDNTWYPLIWGGSTHANTNDSTGAVYKSHDKLSWQTSSQTLYTTNIRTENIRHLSIGGGIYWNPYVESTTDNTNAASITLVRSGVAGGTTLVLSQMNDTNDTIQFKTNAAAKLYHNSYPILTTQNTYVNNHKGYIYGTEITQVNNSDTVDGWHKDNIQWTGYITSPNSIASYWFKMYDITVTEYQYNDITITFLVSEGYSSHFSIFYLRIRQNGTNHSGNYGLEIYLYELVGNLRDKVVAYYNNSTGNVQLWGNTGGQWRTMNYTILKKTLRTNKDSASLGTLTAQLFSSVQTPPSTGYSKVTMARVGSVSYSDSTGSVAWANVTGKPSSYTPSAHTHTVFKNNLMIKGTNGVSDSASIHLGIGDSDTGFKWISDGVCQMYANNVAIGQWTSGGMDWFKNPTVNGNKVWNAGNDGSGSGLDADTLDGEHASRFVRAGHYDSADLNSLDPYSFIKSVYSNVADTSPKGNTGWYNVIQLVHRNGASDGPRYIGQIALGMTSNTNDMFFRGKRTDSWKTVIHSGNIANQSVKYATNAGNSDKVDGYHATDGRTFTGTINWSSNWNDTWSDGTNRHPWYGFDHRYPNTGEYSTTISDYHGMTIKTANNLRLDCAHLLINGVIYINNVNAQIRREGSSQAWVTGRNGALLRETSVAGYHALWSLKTTNGSWDFGEYNAGMGWDNIPVLSYIKDSNYNSGNNEPTYQIKFPLASGTVALTSYGGDESHPIFLGYLNLYHGNDGNISSSFSCLGYSVPFTYTRGGNYCRINIPDTTHQVFFIRAATASVNYSGGGMDTWVGFHRGTGAWWLHCYASGTNEVRVKGFRLHNNNNDSWWGGNPLWSGNDGANKITVCIFGFVIFR